MTFAQILRPAASRSLSHLLSSLPSRLQQRPASLADSALAPRPPLFHRDTSPALPGAPSTHAPTAAHSIPPLQSFRPSQTPYPRFRSRAPLSRVSARFPATPSCTHPNSKRCARSSPNRSSISFFPGLPPTCCPPVLPPHPAPD